MPKLMTQCDSGIKSSTCPQKILIMLNYIQNLFRKLKNSLQHFLETTWPRYLSSSIDFTKHSNSKLSYIYYDVVMSIYIHSIHTHYHIMIDPFLIISKFNWKVKFFIAVLLTEFQPNLLLLYQYIITTPLIQLFIFSMQDATF